MALLNCLKQNADIRNDVPTDEQNETFLLFDGNLRVLALKELGEEQAPCLFAKDFETYTYNHRINRLSTVQEHYMLRRVTCPPKLPSF